MSEADDPNDSSSRLAREIEAAKARRAPPAAPPANYRGMAAGYRMSAEFVAAVIVGAVFGVGVDWLLGSSPAGLILGVFLGFAAGVWGLIRSAKRLNSEQTAASGRDGKD